MDKVGDSMLSDIAGDVKRCVDSHLSYLSGSSKKDYSDFWLNSVEKQCKTELPKNVLPEFTDEINEIKRFLNGEVDADYILRYWKQYEIADYSKVNVGLK